MENKRLSNQKDDKNNSKNLNSTIISNIQRRIFIATEEPKSVIEEAKKHWSDKYEIFYNKLEAKCLILILIKNYLKNTF